MVNGSMNVIEACVDARVRKLIFASSDIAYGNARAIPTPETSPLAGDTPYGAAKATIEHALEAARRRHGLDFVTLRYFSVYGPRLAAEGPNKEVLAHWMERLAAGDPPLIHGDGLQTADFVYVTDVARANVAAALRAPAGEAINIGTGTETSLVDLAAKLARVMGSDLEAEHVGVTPLNPLRRRCAAVGKARRLLGIRSWLELEEGLRATARWWAGDRRLQAAMADRAESSAQQ
jgi:UDP-glucose 4-epimerase